MTERTIDKILEQEKAFKAWMAELPEPKRMTRGEIDQMICDKLKVGDADYHPDTMTEWIYRLKERLGVVIDYSDDEEEEDEEEEKVVQPYIYHRWWQRLASEITVHVGDIQLKLNDDGSHQWRYMTNLQLNGEQKKDWEFIIRNMDETAELRLKWFLLDKDEPEKVGSLQLQTATVSTQMQISEADSKALSESVRELMTRHSKGISAPQERQITEIGEVFPRSYMVTEQIYSSPVLHMDHDDGDEDGDDGDEDGDKVFVLRPLKRD